MSLSHKDLVLVDQPITAAYQITDAVAPLGYDVTCISTESAPLHGRIRVTVVGNQFFLYLKVNQTVLIYGSRLRDYCLVGLFHGDLSKGTTAHAHGHRPVANWTSSFSPRHDETCCQLAPGVPMLVGYIPKHELRQFAEDMGELDAWEQIVQREYAVFHPEDWQALVNATWWRLLEPRPDLIDLKTGRRSAADFYMTLMLQAFNQLQSRPVFQYKRIDTARKIIKFVHEQDTRRITVKDLAKHLNVSGKTLVRGSVDVFGDKPNNVLKAANLENAYRLLSNRALREQLNLYTVEAICKHSGWNSRYHFATGIQKRFGKSPSELMLNSD